MLYTNDFTIYENNNYYGNQITKATDAVSDGPYYQGAWHYRDRTDADEERAYDANGNLTSDSDANISCIQYNSLNLPTVIAFTDGSTTSYQYDALGRKLRVEHKTMTTGTFHPDTGTEDPGDVGSAPDPEVGEEAGEEGGEWQWPVESEEWPELAGLEEMEGEEGEPAEGEEPTLPPTEPLLPPLPPTCLPYEITVTDYVGSYIYENSKLSRLLFDGGFYTFDSDSLNPECHYFFTDHLGSVRVVTDANGNVEQTNNYYPYGGLMASSSIIYFPSSSTTANQPNRYNGKELDRRNALDWHDYGARHFDGIVWRNVDKLAEKYFWVSPYVYCIGNPIKFVDPDGRDWEIYGSNTAKSCYLEMLYHATGNRYSIDDNNILRFDYSDENFTGNKSQTLIQLLDNGINDNVIHSFTLVGDNTDDENVFIDSYSERKVDVADLTLMGETSVALQGAVIGHFLNEIKIGGNYNDAHFNSLEKEGVIYGELINNKTISNRLEIITATNNKQQYIDIRFYYNSSESFILRQQARIQNTPIGKIGVKTDIIGSGKLLKVWKER